MRINLTSSSMAHCVPLSSESCLEKNDCQTCQRSRHIVRTLNAFTKDCIEPKVQRERTSPSAGDHRRTAWNPLKRFNGNKGNTEPKTEHMKAIDSIDDEVFKQFSQEVDIINTAGDAWMHAITLEKQFDISDPCAACGETRYTFQDCKLLNNLPFLK